MAGQYFYNKLESEQIDEEYVYSNYSIEEWNQLESKNKKRQ